MPQGTAAEREEQDARSSRPASAWIRSIERRPTSECPNRNANKSRPWGRRVFSRIGQGWLDGFGARDARQNAGGFCKTFIRGVYSVRFESHAEVRPGLDVRQAELGGQREHGGLGGGEVGLGLGQSLDLGEIAEILGLVERDFDRVPCSTHQKGRSCLANRGDGAEPEQLEQTGATARRPAAPSAKRISISSRVLVGQACADLCR